MIKVLILNSRKYEVVVIGQKWISIRNGQEKKGVFFGQKMKIQKMLKNDVIDSPDWDEAFDLAERIVPFMHQEYLVDDEPIIDLNFPVLEYPTKVKSMSFDKLEVIEGKLMGIKGQYLLFDDNRVLNIRKHNGYRLSFSA